MGTQTSNDEDELLFELAAKLTSTCQDGRFRHQVILTNVRRRMNILKAPSVASYLNYASENEEEFPHLISALTIHTTSWFREPAHFQEMEKEILAKLSKRPNLTFCVLSAACSTGEEIYTAALVLESIRQRYPSFEYQLIGCDIDPVSVQCASQGLYSQNHLREIPPRYKKYLLAGTGKSEGLFTIAKPVRTRCRFKTHNLRHMMSNGQELYDLIFCRNVLIYFSPGDVEKIVRNLLRMLNPEGVLCLGHSEAIDHSKFHVRALGHARYMPTGLGASGASANTLSPGTPAPSRILVVDDSASIRATVLKLLEKSNRVRAAAVASAEEATQYLQTNEVDLITLDLHMPGMSGQEWLKYQRERGMRVPVVIISGASPTEAVEVLGALESGAQDYVDKAVLAQKGDEIIERVTALAEQYRNVAGGTANNPANKAANTLKLVRPDVVLIGASTGGTDCLTKLLKNLPSGFPPLLVTQHITPAFAAPFAQRLAQSSGLVLGEPKNGEPLQSGRLYMAHGDYHIGVSDKKGVLSLEVSDAPPVTRHRPSVDFLFQSAATNCKTNRILAMILTGMGADGARGMLELYKKGCMTLAQNEKSCTVFGMPKEAIRLGAASFVGDPAELRDQLNKSVSKR